MKQYEVHHVEKHGFPGVYFASFEASSDKKAKDQYKPYFDQSKNENHCGIRIIRVSDRRCIFRKFFHSRKIRYDERINYF